MRIILASQSPRRKKLLKQIGLPFSVDPSTYDEIIDKKMTPEELAVYLSRKKAEDVARRYKNALIVGADTFVVFHNEIIGKPQDKTHAFEILKKFSGKTHMIISGITVINTKTGKMISETEQTRVTFRVLSDAEIKAYVQTGEPLDKAGAYGIQERGAKFVKKIEGDYFNVVGLPISKLIYILQQFGIKNF
ncbi:septum formation protein Maf [Candidatus Roizmanbacteria bacterium RIFCSPLOWO2_02_FULL_37_19]|uniref:dTTP/UTP pyrophosphatase n=1 Tax=Candidatus Roizmanbacteria bacterium RIFCSPHIGHO2_02_FULL_37_24 TaxID=1802037 RepID=A0A1F7GUQ9_9BACT|nr:MAG: septum formation protein Maf [Candidatus Roizmanbacteria bacterium RIFCSPHIGHO2_01_FULL_38_41]OGK22524.1 MAG: septum formation protein Maf [Candidatus Roizmanbacteria bacterium RIFCSPHIGHO2_02_FULL_37_24]OGK33924.1 MAG: septum formation protein Maf [Candidatus Roizmanbacteria bacterium RIFCSPHIGHO2_12_FULL_37_23]OGK43408.1 MAG: septum formation protein Maf [Candidatus Roizmanbacteria bacterium RIFCSPLOWO2_01_FULL_37_57]OGK54187.1 MAG: septum formation protein Maf [Candidatus Roizmanbact